MRKGTEPHTRGCPSKDYINLLHGPPGGRGSLSECCFHVVRVEASVPQQRTSVKSVGTGCDSHSLGQSRLRQRQNLGQPRFSKLSRRDSSAPWQTQSSTGEQFPYKMTTMTVLSRENDRLT